MGEKGQFRTNQLVRNTMLGLLSSIGLFARIDTFKLLVYISIQRSNISRTSKLQRKERIFLGSRISLNPHSVV